MREETSNAPSTVMRAHARSIGFLLVGIALPPLIIIGIKNIEVTEKVFGMIGSFSLAVGLATYYYKKNQDKTSAAIDQVTFFRTQIVPKWDDVSMLIRNTNPNYRFVRLDFDLPDLSTIREKHPEEFRIQSEAFFCGPEEKPIWNPEILDVEVHLFNMLEEFSLRIWHLKTVDHPALESVYSAFVQIVEKNAVAGLFIRDVVMGNPIYSKTLELYQSWKVKVNRSENIPKRLHQHGFITNEQKKQMYSRIK